MQIGQIKRAVTELFREQVIAMWRCRRTGTPPPHAFKQRLVKSFRQRFNLDTLVETGTFRGDMVAAMRQRFVEIYSVEIDENLYRRVSARFRKYPHVHIVLGDSAVVLPDILTSLRRPALFWLDGHYSGPGTGRSTQHTPISDELAHIVALGQPGQVILIDDARMFVGRNGYPSLSDLHGWVMANTQFRSFEVADDVIRIF